MGDAHRKQRMTHYANHSVGRKKSSVELVNQILQHDPGASVEMIASVLSQWASLVDDHPGEPCQVGEKQGQHPAGD
jgi:hypothetical protein